MFAYAAAAGLVVSALGIVIGILPPQPAGMWGAETEAELRKERRDRQRYWTSVVLIGIGTLLQLRATLP
jgi:hypothetical protein